jgi:hypothetical protein
VSSCRPGRGRAAPAGHRLLAVVPVSESARGGLGPPLGHRPRLASPILSSLMPGSTGCRGCPSEVDFRGPDRSPRQEARLPRGRESGPRGTGFWTRHPGWGSGVRRSGLLLPTIIARCDDFGRGNRRRGSTSTSTTLPPPSPRHSTDPTWLGWVPGGSPGWPTTRESRREARGFNATTGTDHHRDTSEHRSM